MTTTTERRVPNAPDETWACGWLIDGGITEDGDRYIFECGAPTHPWKAGWACENGHAHRGIEIEWELDALREDLERRGLVEVVG